MSNRTNSERLFREAKAHLVGGVNSPVRAYRGFDFAPPFIERAAGSHIWDADGNEYIDYVGSWGPAILGHAHPDIVAAIKDAASMGTSFGAPTEKETELAKLVKGAFPSIDLVRFVSSGTEAVMGAIRAARGFTGRDKIIKFKGCYHGHADHLLVKAGSGAATFGAPDSAGVPEDFAKHTLIAEYNDLDGVKELVKKFGNDLAAIIVEPVAGNMGCVPPANGFLKGLRAVCDDNDVVLIFDEVITGFRLAFGGAQELYGVRPDMTCLGKILGGGLPVGAYGGSKKIMEKVSPLGPVYQAGTLSGNPLAVSAGIATLKALKGEPPLPLGERDRVRGSIYPYIDELTEHLTSSMSRIFAQKNIEHSFKRVGSMFSFFFDSEDMFKKFFIHMLDNGVYFAPSQFECAFIGNAHSRSDIESTIGVLERL